MNTPLAVALMHMYVKPHIAEILLSAPNEHEAAKVVEANLDEIKKVWTGPMGEYNRLASWALRYGESFTD